ncbi:hypothetical protein C2845_PM03G30200 [Panicum miliaceum]|uniref:Protein FAR1-RELATED SEQUENCE n=1 Tax=Panicum miliaceum TaxID=4540 RepID=A0A3L6TB12_PANMI|nr:hypothetical protein C2845_PM03G30200 [Panicum miliaceum]
MGGKDPINIIIDQDLAMAAAISQVFTTSVHMNCRWHIMENARKRLGAFLDGKPDLADDFNDCVDNSFSILEFESKWQSMLDKHEINGDERFKHLYEMRYCWVLAYFMNNFFPFLQTTARSEGFNAFLKRYVNPMNSILNFVHQYKKMQDMIFSKQIMHEANTTVKVPHYLTGDNLIDVVPYGRCPNHLYGERTFRFSANSVGGLYSYDCCKFQRDGVLCCHIVKVFDALAVCEVPGHYILPRWSAEKVDDGENVEVAGEPLQATHITIQGRHAVRYHAICTNFAKIVRPFMVGDESHNIVLKHVAVMQVELNARKNGGLLSSASQAQGNVAQTQNIAGAGQRGGKTSKKKLGNVDTAPSLQSSMVFLYAEKYNVNFYATYEQFV